MAGVAVQDQRGHRGTAQPVWVRERIVSEESKLPDPNSFLTDEVRTRLQVLPTVMLAAMQQGLCLSYTSGKFATPLIPLLLVILWAC